MSFSVEPVPSEQAHIAICLMIALAINALEAV